ncbi:MAG: VWA domain-containing protein [Pseudomonadota bacterium]|nr:VWA domain-containing protein [Pseudomonadota bacterium]
MEWLSNFHFIRPLWLLALIPALLTLFIVHRRRAAAGQWQQVVDPQLLPYLLEQPGSGAARGQAAPRLLMIAAAVIVSLALAGPAWERLPQPVQKNKDALIIMLDMSASMGAQDVKPSRAVRAIQKVTDIVRARRDGQTALLVYAGDAHTVTPLTDDTDTIENLLPAISPFIMPSAGSRPDKAIALAQQLAADAGVARARLLLITDGIQAKDVDRIRDVLEPSRSQLAVIALGTQEGAPVPMPGSGFLRDGQGNIVLPRLDTTPLQALSSETAVPWLRMSLDDSDWQQLLPNDPQARQRPQDDQGRTFDLWADQGYWLVLLLLPLALLLFRRGVLLSLLLLPALWPDQSYALSWDELWQTPDQRAQAMLDNQDAAGAAATFEDPQWRGTAAYRAGDYQSAAQAFASAPDNAHAQYNLGNALAMQGQLEAAAQAYEKALQLQPDFPAAEENLARIRQQQQQQNPQSGDSQQQDNQQQDNQQQDNQQQDGQQQSSQQDQSGQQNGQQGQNGQPQNPSEPSDAGEQNQNGTAQQNDQQAQQNGEVQQQQDGQSEQQTGQQDSAADSEDDSGQDGQSAQLLGKDGQPLSREEREAMQQWLNRVPDQPGNLLQRKFLYQYRQQEDHESGDVLW